MFEYDVSRNEWIYQRFNNSNRQELTIFVSLDTQATPSFSSTFFDHVSVQQTTLVTTSFWLVHCQAKDTPH
jgi:hypothetical protein